MMKKSLFYMAVTLLLLPAVILAQSTPNTCPDIVNTAIQAADELCEGLGRNSICYGNFKLDATPQEGANWSFEQVGDVEDVNNLEQLKLSVMSEASGEWGVAVMSLQANLPDTLPGQNVTFILFGDVAIENATTTEQVENNEFSPMQAFYLTTGIGDAGCSEAPESGMLVQTPKGVGEVTFNVNGVDVAIGSTVFFQAPSQQQLNVTTVEGVAILQSDEKLYPVLAGTHFEVERDEQGELIPITEAPESYEDRLDGLAVLPLGLLDREIEIHPPFSGEELEELQWRIENGEPLCGEPPFPPCEELPAILGGEACIFPEAYENNIVPPELIGLPFCEASMFFGQNPGILFPIEGVNCVAEYTDEGENALPLCADLAHSVEDQFGCVMRPPEGEALAEGETRPFCDEIIRQPDCVMRPPEGEELPEGETRPFCDEIMPPQGCVMPPAPGETLPEGETRPLCEVDNNMPPLDCVARPPEGEELPEGETRPFCDEIMPPLDCVARPPEGEELPEGETRPFCDEIMPPLEGCVMPPAPGETLPEGETRPLCEVSMPPADTRPCVTRPGPNDPPLPSTETRPFCEDLGITPPPPPNPNNVTPPLPPEITPTPTN